MPLHIDEKWEYWQPDEEIAELLGVNNEAEATVASLCIDWDAVSKKTSSGFRFGRGNPDNFFCRLAPDKWTRVREKTRKQLRRTNIKEHWTGPGRGRRRVLEDRKCLACETVFRPREENHRICKQGCVGHHQRQLAAKQKPKWFKLFKSLYLANMKMTDIAKQVGVSLPTLKRVKRKFLPSRPSGNHSRRNNEVLDS